MNGRGGPRAGRGSRGSPSRGKRRTITASPAASGPEADVLRDGEGKSASPGRRRRRPAPRAPRESPGPRQRPSTRRSRSGPGPVSRIRRSAGASLVFPHPEGPNSARMRPLSTVKDSPSVAGGRSAPKRFVTCSRWTSAIDQASQPVVTAPGSAEASLRGRPGNCGRRASPWQPACRTKRSRCAAPARHSSGG